MRQDLAFAARLMRKTPGFTATAGGALGVALAYAFARTSATLISRFMPTVYGANRSLGSSSHQMRAS